MTAEYSAGPWRVRSKPTGTGCLSKVECAAGYVVAEAFSSPSCGTPYKLLWAEAEANARLIAAAPDLLDVLIRAKDAIEALDGTTVENEKLVDDYRSVIQKIHVSA